MSIAENPKNLLSRDDPRHGTVNGYQNYGCRCPECKAVHSANMKIQRRKRFEQGLGPDDPRHGTDNGYTNYGCRCYECRGARAEWYANRKVI